MPRHLISDAHEWINEIPTVPIYYLAKPQSRERAWHIQRGKKTLLSLTLVWSVGCHRGCSIRRSASNLEILLPLSMTCLLCETAPCLWRVFVLRLTLLSAELCRGQFQVGSLAGAAHLLNDNAGVLGWAQRERKSLVDQKGKSSLDFDFQYEYKLWKHGLSILYL